jgi:hypothetical protein
LFVKKKLAWYIVGTGAGVGAGGTGAASKFLPGAATLQSFRLMFLASKPLISVAQQRHYFYASPALTQYFKGQGSEVETSVKRSFSTASIILSF